MTQRDERGRFTRRPVLHRQVADGEPYRHWSEVDLAGAELLQPEPTPSRWPWVFFAIALAVVGVMGLLLMGAR